MDSLRNLLSYQHMALLFPITGVGEMLQVNRWASISVEPQRPKRFTVQGKPPIAGPMCQVREPYWRR